MREERSTGLKRVSKTYLIIAVEGEVEAEAQQNTQNGVKNTLVAPTVQISASSTSLPKSPTYPRVNFLPLHCRSYRFEQTLEDHAMGKWASAGPFTRCQVHPPTVCTLFFREYNSSNLGISMNWSRSRTS